jgi:hypothetical protein
MNDAEERWKREKRELQSQADQMAQQQAKEQAKMEKQLRGQVGSAIEEAVRAKEHARRAKQRHRELENEVTKLKGELAAASTLAAVSAVEQVPSMGGVELGELEEAVHLRRQRLTMERMRADAQTEARRECEREREVMRDARLCAICLDKPNDTAYGCGHQACAGCAGELVNCHIYVVRLSVSERSYTFKKRCMQHRIAWGTCRTFF